MDERNKPAFWLAATAAFAVICIPSLTLLDSIQGYRRFLVGFEPGTLRPSRMQSAPHRADARGLEPKLDFVSFRFKNRKAKSVQLIGEFNGWKPGTLALTRQEGGAWELLVPLPRGRYHYLFLVDGAEKLDPGNASQDEIGGRLASVKVVR